MTLDLLTAFWRRDQASALHYRAANDLAVHTSAGSRTELSTASWQSPEQDVAKMLLMGGVLGDSRSSR